MRAGKGYVDVTHGHATPFVADFYGKGTRDLLVGQFEGGLMRVYKNQSKAKDIQLESFEWFRAGGQIAKVAYGCCIGFSPRFGDFDNDGVSDILSGSSEGQISFFKGHKDGQYDSGVFLSTEDGNELAFGSGTTVSLYDFDADGKLDLIVGTIAGQVYYSKNQGNLKLGASIQLKIGSEDIEALGGGPAAVDWDNDGVMDLFLGCDPGKIMYLKGVKNKKVPTFEKEIEIYPSYSERDVDPIAPSQFNPIDWPLSRPGMRPKPSVADWDGDGKLDLIVGDVRALQDEDQIHTNEQKKRYQELSSQANELKKIADIRYEAIKKQAISNLKIDPNKKQSAEESLKFSAEFSRLYDLDKVATDTDSKLADLFEQMKPVMPPISNHGFVWVFLHK